MRNKLTSLTMFDLLKGIAILGVVIFHSTNNVGESFGDSAMRLVMMPMFFVVSGYWLKKKKTEKGIKYSVQYVLKPYLYTAVAIILFAGMLKIIQGKNPLTYMLYHAGAFILGLNDAGGTMIGNVAFGWNGPLWFMLALFFGWCIFFTIINIKDEKVQLISVIVITIAGYVMFLFKNIVLVFDIPQAMVATSYLYLGYKIKKLDLFNKKTKWYIWTLLLAIWLVVACFGHLDLASGTFKLGILEVIGSMAGSYLMLAMFLRINKLELKWLLPLETIGRYTNWILCVHTVEMMVFPWEAILAKLPNIEFLHINISLLIFRSVIIAVGCVILKMYPRVVEIICRTNIIKNMIRRNEKKI